MRIIKKGATSQSVYVEVLDSTSTTGGRKTGLVFNTSSLTAYYVRNQSTATAITLATLAAANTAWSSGGFKEVDATNMPGVYRLDVPDAAFAAGSGDDVSITLKGATGMAQVSIGVQLVAYDPQDSVRFGLTALPNAAASAIGGLLTAPTTANVGLADLSRILGTALTETAGQIAAGFKKVFDVAAPVFTAASVNQTGDSFARLGPPAGASTAADIAAVKSDTGTILTDVNSGAGAIYTRLGAPAGASIAADVAAVNAKTTNLPASPAAVSDIPTASAITTAVWGALTSALTTVGSIGKLLAQLTFTSANKVDANVLALNGDATSAANVAKTTRAIGRGTVGSSASTTSIPTSAFTPSGVAADQFKGRIITFDADTATTALRGQSTDITASSNASTPTLTVTALTTAPASGDTFSVT